MFLSMMKIIDFAGDCQEKFFTRPWCNVRQIMAKLFGIQQEGLNRWRDFESYFRV